LLAKFLNLFKSQNTTIQTLKTEAKKHPSWRRYNTIIDIFEPLNEDYEHYLQATNTIDNNDIINQATKHITKRDHIPEFKYILLDEFQDITKSQHNLLKSILDKNRNCQIFCIGDDWQSIHRFNGSDVSIMTNFGDYYNPNEITFLDETFRLNDSLANFSSTFIMKNPEQYKKKLKAKQVDYKSVTIVCYDDINQAIKETIKKIEKIEEEKANVLITSRYDLVFYPNLKKTTINSMLNDENDSKLSISYSTAHESKDKEVDYVILIGLKSGAYGFPCEIEDDPVLNLVLTQENMYPNSEERRVFYVAITRAKKRVYLLADKNTQSAFIKEIQNENYDMTEVDVSP
jgi:DNA helicase-4